MSYQLVGQMVAVAAGVTLAVGAAGLGVLALIVAFADPADTDPQGVQLRLRR